MHLLFSSISVKISTGSVSPERGENMGHFRSSSGILLLLMISCIAFLNLITTSMASESEGGKIDIVHYILPLCLYKKLPRTCYEKKKKKNCSMLSKSTSECPSELTNVEANL